MASASPSASQPAPAAVRLERVVKRFGDVEAVAGIDLEVAEGEFFSMLGPSGSGKTTTLRMIAGFELPTAGRIEIDGRDLTNVPANRRNVGMVFQSYALFPNMSVADNIGFGLKIRRRPKDEIRRKVADLLDLIQIGRAHV